MTEQAKIATVGLSGLLVSFGDTLTEAANRAALAFRAAVDAQDWPEVSETSSSLVSTFVLCDLATVDVADLRGRLTDLLNSQNWADAPLPKGRKLWHVPTVYGTDLAPQLEEAATLAGLDPDTAIKELSSARVRVLTIGFAPGQPYMAELPAHWNIPRQEALTRSVPGGALITAIRQLIIFTAASPTGWRHIGQTAFQTFRPEADPPFALTPGDELIFPSVERSALIRLQAKNSARQGGADYEVLP
jgi:KipI family sensor histidine kinase inhibitor